MKASETGTEAISTAGTGRGDLPSYEQVQTGIGKLYTVPVLYTENQLEAAITHPPLSWPCKAHLTSKKF